MPDSRKQGHAKVQQAYICNHSWIHFELSIHNLFRVVTNTAVRGIELVTVLRIHGHTSNGLCSDIMWAIFRISDDDCRVRFREAGICEGDVDADKLLAAHFVNRFHHMIYVCFNSQ